MKDEQAEFLKGRAASARQSQGLKEEIKDYAIKEENMKEKSINAKAAGIFAAAILAPSFASDGGAFLAASGAAPSGSAPAYIAQDDPAKERKVFEAPASIPQEIIAAINADKATFLQELDSLLSADSEGLLLLVDKAHYLPDGYAPDDLISLTQATAQGRSYTISRDGLSLRRPAEKALEEMAAAARADGVTLLASSTYRSYEYRETVYRRNVEQMGQAAADRESARPGASQHQLGTVVDFGSITDDFAETRAGRWLDANAHRFGWSLSFPQGHEAVTGYRWECWHYRYLGKEALNLQRKWFGNVQQYMLEFIDAWRAFQGI